MFKTEKLLNNIKQLTTKKEYWQKKNFEYHFHVKEYLGIFFPTLQFTLKNVGQDLQVWYMMICCDILILKFRFLTIFTMSAIQNSYSKWLLFIFSQLIFLMFLRISQFKSCHWFLTLNIDFNNSSWKELISKFPLSINNPSLVFMNRFI